MKARTFLLLAASLALVAAAPPPAEAHIVTCIGDAACFVHCNTSHALAGPNPDYHRCEYEPLGGGLP